MLDDPTTTGNPAASLRRSCLGCSGRLRPRGYARARTRRVRGRRGRQPLIRPRRVRCAGCRVTHVLLPASRGAPHRADAVEVIGSALLANAACGHGRSRIAADLDLPPATVRGWNRRASCGAETSRIRAIQWLVVLDRLAAPLNPTGTALSDALGSLGTAFAVAIRRLV